MTASLQLTYTGVLLAVFANQVCLPIPSVVFLMTAGALSAEGKMRASIIILLAVLGCLAGDGIWFWFGRRWGSGAMRLICRFSSDPRKCGTEAHEYFRRLGLPVLCVAKFLPGLDGVLPPLVAAEGVALARFLAFDLLGSLLWASVYVVLGYVFANELEIAIGWARQFGTALAFVIGIPVAVYVGWRGLAPVRMIRGLRLRRISPAMLDRKLKSSSKVAVLDLLEFEDLDAESLESIPGALRVEPSRLRKSPRFTVPDDVQIVLYCSSGGDMVSARVAMELNRIGVHKVWVLEGGLNAWRQQGFPISRCSEPPEVIVERLGVKLPEPLRKRTLQRVNE